MGQTRESALALANNWLEARIRLGDEVWTKGRRMESWQAGQMCWTVHVGDTMFGAATGKRVGQLLDNPVDFQLVRFGELEDEPFWFRADGDKSRVAAVTWWLRSRVLKISWETPLLPRVRPTVLRPFPVPQKKPWGRPRAQGAVVVSGPAAMAARALIRDAGGARVVAAALGVDASLVRHWLRGARSLPGRHVEALVDLASGAV